MKHGGFRQVSFSYFPIIAIAYDIRSRILAPYKAVTYCSKVCPYPCPLHWCHYYMDDAGHSLEECIGMFHSCSYPEYSKIPADTLHGKLVAPHRPTHGAIDAFAFRTEISLIMVTNNTGNAEIDLGIMNICRCKISQLFSSR